MSSQWREPEPVLASLNLSLLCRAWARVPTGWVYMVLSPLFCM